MPSFWPPRLPRRPASQPLRCWSEKEKARHRCRFRWRPGAATSRGRCGRGCLRRVRSSSWTTCSPPAPPPLRRPAPSRPRGPIESLAWRSLALPGLPPGPAGKGPPMTGLALPIIGPGLRLGLWLRGRREKRPSVHASRRRKDPRKATIGRRARCDLGVSPASSPGRSRETGEGSKHAFSGFVETGTRTKPGVRGLSRRMWGQRPGQPGGVPFSPAAPALGKR
jgi:hypothetical protein